MKQFQKVILGGTFDLLHNGHKALINRAFEAGEKVIIGVTSDFFGQKNRNFQYHLPANGSCRRQVQAGISNFQLRKKELEDYLNENNLLNRSEIIEINDRFGTTLNDSSLQAIAVSPETQPVAWEINQLRLQKKWPELKIILVPWVMANDNKPIHSYRIRAGEIDRKGKLFALEKNWGKRYLPDDLREEFKTPMGELVSHLSKLKDLKNKKLIAIGDATVAKLLKNDIIPDISIVDLKIHRIEVYKNVENIGFRNIKLLKKVRNPAGTLSFEAYSVLVELMKTEAKPAVMQIDGEDDLLTLFAIFLAPLNSLIVYGQPPFTKASGGKPDEGMVKVEVTEERKNKARYYLEKFK